MEFKTLKQYVKELMSSMERSDIKRLSIKLDKIELEIEREEKRKENSHKNEADGPAQLLRSHADLHHELHLHKDTSKLPAWQQGGPYVYPGKEPSSAEHQPAPAEEGTLISSPMVGTFYSSPAPDQPSFVEEGDQVIEESVVCIVEAMKVMNEIKAGVKGVIVERFVESGDPVEFGTKLFRVV